MSRSLRFQSREIATDEEGFLLDPGDWSPELARTIAANIGIELTEAHWEVVNFVRRHFETRLAVPELRTYLKHLRERHGKARATRRYVYRLFPYGYGQQACKIAGMRKPRKLMLDV